MKMKEDAIKKEIIQLVKKISDFKVLKLILLYVKGKM